MNNRSSIIACAGFAASMLAAPVSVSARSPAQPETCTPQQKETVKNFFLKWNTSLSARGEGPVVLYGDGATLLPTLEVGPYKKGSGPEFAKYFSDFVKRTPKATIDESKRTIFCGSNIAYDTGLYTFQLHSPDETVKARYTFIYQFRGGVWQIVHHHASIEPPSKPKP